MRRLVWINVILIGIVAMPPFQARADACAAAEREMVYGSTALEDAKDKNGFLESAAQFKAAVAKAPNCAQAHFNLGLMYEKAGEYQKAIGPLQTYLKLAPNADDAAQVKKKIYALEYRIKRAAQTKHAAEVQKQDARRLLKNVVGTWDRKCANPYHNAPNWEFAVDGDFVKWRFFHNELGGWSGFSNGEKYNFKTNQFEMIGGVLVEVKSKELLESTGGQICTYRRQ